MSTPDERPWPSRYDPAVLGITHSPWYSAFKALIDVLCYPMKLLDGRGRTGGVVALLIGLVSIPLGWWIATTTSLLGLGLCGVGLAYCFYGLSKLFGTEARLARDFGLETVVPDRLSRDALEEVLKTRALPFFVCTRCRVVMTPGDCGGQCLVCGSEADCLPVTEQPDRELARSALY